MIEAHDSFVRPYKVRLVHIYNIQLNSIYKMCSNWTDRVVI